MKMPGFAAEASLYKTSQVYGGYSGAAGGDAALSVVPAQFCGDACIATCILGFGGGCAAVCIAAFGLPPFWPLLIPCVAAACPAMAAACSATCPACPVDPCATCTNCHKTWIGWCFCNGKNCGWTSHCCG
jgi:hypothetical protein